MSNVSGLTTIKYVKQGDTLSCALRSTFPLKQFITNGTNAVTPSFATYQPCIYPVIRSSLTATRLSPLVSSVVWMYNGSVISFDANGLSTAMGAIAAGTFKSEVKTIDGFSVPTLTILKNIASASNIDSDTILFQATVNTGFSTTVSASIEVGVEQTDGEAFIAYITVNNGGVIDDNVSTLTLRAHLMIGGSEQSSNVTYAWYKMVVTNGADGWVALNKTTQSITIAASDINSSELYKCVVSFSGKSADAVLEVADETDTLIIFPNPTDGAGNTVPEELNPTGQTAIIYAPEVRKRESQAVQSGFTFYYLLTNSSGDEINSQDGGGTFTVTLANAQAAQGDLTLIITATK
ncbi:MAG: hypothetical protein IK113_00875 [Bacteroidales bacterium]|nr:hypothetical protein [Bacteroidales bacterium]